MQKVIIDTDPGIDDALAIFVALNSPELEVLGLTTVRGNTGVATCAANALTLLAIGGRPEIPVHVGADQPLLGEAALALEPPQTVWVHGENGAGNVETRLRPGEPDGSDAAGFIVSCAEAHPDEVVLLAIGPLTNLAHAILRAPDTMRRIKEFVVMGGAVGSPGNVTPVAEANVAHDPEAASIVFGFGVPVTMAGLNVTMEVLIGPEDDARLAQAEGAPARYAYALTRHYRAVHEGRGLAGRYPMHDATTLAYLVRPQLFERVATPIGVELHGRLTRGQTVADLRGGAARHRDRAHAGVLIEVDAAGVRGLILDRILGLSSEVHWEPDDWNAAANEA